ncbi:tripartite tricarboxylate transporter substrate-binding protein [Clostridium transplantifaecale]|uniref:tripartite tricarboxylate transporter substrate-binding protein n=1 Tax=Clostridium transplantifaecale TaxID=2479838 RepID=UPI000F638465|nr:tripartite tricarboxylate transporter substrate-binding protein [Clostridium transplantifaecale]
MKKRVLALAMAAAMAVSLAGCGNSGSGAAETKAASDGQTEAAADANAPAAGGSGQTIKLICPYGVGGTADAIARKYALVAGKVHPEYNFIVENMTGGDGFSAANWYTDQDPSTKDLLMFGCGVAYRHDLGKAYQTEVVDFDRNDIYPVALVDDRTWIMYAKPDTSLAEILEKSKTGGIKMSGGNPLSDPHLALGSLIAQEGGKVMVVPYDGGAAQKKGLTDGEVDVFVGTTQAGQEDVEAGTMVPVLAFSDKKFEGFVGPNGPVEVPGIAGDAKDPALNADTDYSGSILPAGGFIAVRTGADQAWIDEIAQISKDVWAAPEYSDWIAEIMLNKSEAYGDDAKAYLEGGCAKALTAFETLSGQQ